MIKIFYRFVRWLDVNITERRMWLRYKLNRKKYEKTKQWLLIGDDPKAIPYQEAYRQVDQFIRQTVNLSARPYGHGAYGLVVAAIWKDSDRTDRVHIDFRYSEREAVYERIKRHMESWQPPPRAIMAGVLPYGELARGL